MVDAVGKDDERRIKKAEPLSGLGALVLGVGIGALLSGLLKAYAVPILLIGILTHAWGMFDKHMLQGISPQARPLWSEVLYWVCWLALLALIVFVAVGYLRS